MTSSSLPQPKTAVGQTFRDQIERLRVHSEKEAQAIRNESPPEWYRPTGLLASVLDIEAMHEPYTREEHEDQFAQAVKNSEEPGTTGDLAMVSLQGDFLASLERAFRDRNMTSVRRRVQTSARRTGHSAETGVINLGLLGYIERINEFNKAEFQGPEPSDVLGDSVDVGGIV